MSNAITTSLVRFGKSILSWSNRFVKFTKHRMLTHKKNILIIGDEDSPIYLKLYPLIAKNWEIVHIAESMPPVEEPVDQPEAQASSGTAPAEEKQLVVPPKQKKFFKRLFLHNENYNEIESQLVGKQFDSIIVLPKLDSKVSVLNIEDQNFVVDIPALHQNLLMRNLFAYRLASNCLTSSGVIILSISQRDFIKDNQIEYKLLSEGRNYWFSNELIDAQVNYLGVVIGDRDHTDLNSWTIVALSKQISEQDSDFVAKYYKIWADSQSLPMPGTFALFRRKTASSKTHFVQYL